MVIFMLLGPQTAGAAMRRLAFAALLMRLGQQAVWRRRATCARIRRRHHIFRLRAERGTREKVPYL
jgi:hypothetical protein